MKKWVAILSVLALIVCSSCSGKIHSYEDGYDDGFRDGRSEGEYYGYEDGYEDGYEIGNENYREHGWWFEEQAVARAREYSSFHPVEAMEVIDAYENNKPIYGSIPTEDDYNDAIKSLYYFYEYFCYARYND